MRLNSNLQSIPRPATCVLAAALMAMPVARGLAAEVNLPLVSVGAGMRSSFTNLKVDGASEDVNDFALSSARIYLNGKATETIGFMFNTEYSASDEKIRVIDAVAQFSFSDGFNIWAGRFLAPIDRAGLYGPYYASHWGVYQDGVEGGYPFESEGRDDGLMYWGQLGIAKLAFGAFDVSSLTGADSDVLYAARVQLDFWDPEPGYYQSATYYGDKDLLALGVAGQSAAGDNAYSVDFLLEKKLGSSAVITIEAEYAKYDDLGGYPVPRSFDADPGPGVTLTPLGYDASDGYYLLGAYLFPTQIGIGKLQLLGKFGETTYDYVPGADVDQTTAEVNLNYLIRGVNARLSLFYIDVNNKSSAPFVTPDSRQLGLGVQVQM